MYGTESQPVHKHYTAVLTPYTNATNAEHYPLGIAIQKKETFIQEFGIYLYECLLNMSSDIFIYSMQCHSIIHSASAHHASGLGEATGLSCNILSC